MMALQIIVVKFAMNMPKKVDIRKMHKKITDYHRNLIINTKIFYVLNRA